MNSTDFITLLKAAKSLEKWPKPEVVSARKRRTRASVTGQRVSYNAYGAIQNQGMEEQQNETAMLFKRKQSTSEEIGSKKRKENGRRFGKKGRVPARALSSDTLWEGKLGRKQLANWVQEMSEMGSLDIMSKTTQAHSTFKKITASKRDYSEFKAALLSDDESNTSSQCSEPKSSAEWMNLTPEERLNQNFRTLASVGIPLAKITELKCLQQNLVRIHMGSLMKTKFSCPACTYELEVGDIVRNDNKLECKGVIRGVLCNQIHSFSFCRNTVFSNDIGPLRHCDSCRKCVDLRTKHCNKCDQCYISRTEARYGDNNHSYCPCETGQFEEECIDDGCRLC